MGDFNDIARVDEQWGSCNNNIGNIFKFNNAVNECGIMDLGSEGHKFSWVRYTGSRIVLKKKLDKVLWNRGPIIIPGS